MNIGLESVSRGMPPSFAAGAAGMPATVKPTEGWKSHAVGATELAKVAGEEEIDERELRRDDPLGNLVARAFDSGLASQMLRPLPIGVGE